MLYINEQISVKIIILCLEIFDLNLGLRGARSVQKVKLRLNVRTSSSLREWRKQKTGRNLGWKKKMRRQKDFAWID